MYISKCSDVHLIYLPCTVATMMLLYHFWVHRIGCNHSTFALWMNGELGILMDSPLGENCCGYTLVY
jgi:hypothetical protein